MAERPSHCAPYWFTHTDGWNELQNKTK